jgi:Na+-driven multidrug efflux pump
MGCGQRVIEITDWDSETKRLVSLAIPFSIQGCVEGVFQTLNVAAIGNFVGTKEANAYVVVTILLEFTNTFNYGFSEGKE